MGIRVLVFDLDGTLLDTMSDLAVAANEALVHMGFPARTQEEMLSYMGYGGRWLIEQLVPEWATADQRRRTFELWRELYIASDYALTAPFDGVVEAVRELRSHGVKTAVLSNKFDAGVRTLVQRHFPDLFDVARGDAPPMPRKPDPTGLLKMLDDLGADRGEAAYVGDSIVDVKVARNAGAKAVGVAWGYDAAAPLPVDELDAYVMTPADFKMMRYL